MTRSLIHSPWLAESIAKPQSPSQVGLLHNVMQRWLTPVSAIRPNRCRPNSSLWRRCTVPVKRQQSACGKEVRFPRTRYGVELAGAADGGDVMIDFDFGSPDPCHGLLEAT
jgi:hypothetical protein